MIAPTLGCPPREPNSIVTWPESCELNKQLSNSRAPRAIIVDTRPDRNRIQVSSNVNNIALIAPPIKRKFKTRNAQTKFSSLGLRNDIVRNHIVDRAIDFNRGSDRLWVCPVQPVNKRLSGLASDNHRWDTLTEVVRNYAGYRTLVRNIVVKNGCGSSGIFRKGGFERKRAPAAGNERDLLYVRSHVHITRQEGNLPCR
jgi:hypothetical protein